MFTIFYRRFELLEKINKNRFVILVDENFNFRAKIKLNKEPNYEVNGQNLFLLNKDIEITNTLRSIDFLNSNLVVNTIF